MVRPLGGAEVQWIFALIRLAPVPLAGRRKMVFFNTLLERFHNDMFRELRHGC